MGKFIIVDTETGGLDPKIHSLLSVAILVVDEDTLEPVDQFEVKIKHPVYHVDPYAMKVNNINLATWEGASLDSAALLLLNFIAKHFGADKVLVGGHNTAFDLGFLRENFPTVVKSFQYGVGLDTKVIVEYLRKKGKYPKEGSSSLEPVTKHFGIQIDGTYHDALSDAKVTLELLKFFVQNDM